MHLRHWRLQARGMIEELPGHAEFVRQICSQSFDTECFGRVMATVKNIQTQFFGKRVSPMRSLAGDESVHALRGSFFQLAPRSTSHHADAFATFITTWK